MASVRIARNAIIAKILDYDKNIINFVNGLLSYTVEMGRYGQWSETLSFLTLHNRTFPAGFVHLVQEELSKAGHLVQLIQKPLLKPEGEKNPVVDKFGNDDPRYDYQLKALRQVEKHGSGILRVSTGGGKSKIAMLIMKRYRKTTLFLSTRGILLHQMNEQLKAIGLNTGFIGDGEKRFVRGVNLGMVQTLIQALEEPNLNKEILKIIANYHKISETGEIMPRDKARKLAEAIVEQKTRRRNAILKFLEMVEVVIGEEAHEVGGTSYYEILRHCKNASIRVALTATPFMRESAEDNMRLMAAFGSILIDVSEKTLIERGILAKPYFKFIDSEPHCKLNKSSPYERALQLGYVENENLIRNMIRDALRAKERRLPVLTLIGRKKFGEVLKAAYTRAGIRTEFLKGADDMTERRTKLDALQQGKIDCVIGTTVLDVGVDVPSIGLVQLGGGGKAEVALRQRIGRGLRAKKQGANVAFIADYSCNANAHLLMHARQREEIIRQTPGFIEGILKRGQDFDWDLFPKVTSNTKRSRYYAR